MKIYIDSDFKCHVSNTDNVFREFDVSFFNGKCETFIEGYCYVPNGETWVRFDGIEFIGEMIFPWKQYTELNRAQRKYERSRVLEYETKEIELTTSYTEGVNSI